uniref:Uncharacterized protein n=1 Tax=Knipowitschia caucasica TaxID=637954 RepID=A0AAV2J710_KNICA
MAPRPALTLLPRHGNMLLKVRLGDSQKFIKLAEPNLTDFLNAVFAKFGVPPVREGVTILDSSGTEVDEEVFEDIVSSPSVGVLTIKYDGEPVSVVPSPDSASTESSSDTIPVVTTPESCRSPSLDLSDSQETIIISDTPAGKRQRLDSESKQCVESILARKPGGDRIMNEYNRTKSLTDESRRKMVNMLVADMTEKNGSSPTRQVKEMYARGIVTLFPSLSDPFSKNGYEHYYDSQSGSGYLAWRIKTIQRSTARDRRASFEEGRPGKTTEGGPTARRELQYLPEKNLSEDDNVLSEFPRFKDVKGLIEQDFVLMFGEGASGKLLERWPTTFKKKVIQQCRKLPSTSEIEELLLAADPPEDVTEVDAGWDSDLSSILLLSHLIPPTAQGRKKPGKVSATQAEKHLVVFKKTGTSIQEHLDEITTSNQPYLLAVGVHGMSENDIAGRVDNEQL